ncbi:ash family protein [Pseudomonas sp. CDFA 602]|nr:ash family protein [Pseudomonas californiensis]MCD5999446.1 ash family protein [Pseudomonas californiensis]
MTLFFTINDQRSIVEIASNRDARYRLRVVANSATGRRNPWNNLAHVAPPFRLLALYFCPQFNVMAAVCEQASAWLGSKFPSIPTSHMAATQSRRKDRGSSKTNLELPMTSIIPSALRALAHRRMALSALRANSSLSVRLNRYNSHMDRARALENAGGAQ